MSKIVTITLGELGGSPKQAGWLILSYSTGGGRTSIGAYMKMKPAVLTADQSAILEPGRLPSWSEVAQDLLSNMSRPEWPTFVKAKAQGNQLRLSCPDELDPAVFFAEFNPSEDQSAPHQLSPSFVKIEQEGF